MIWASCLALAASHTCRSFHCHAAVAVFRPVSQIVAFQISCEKECAWDADSNRTWRTVIAATAEIGAQLMADLFHFCKLCLCKRCCVRACLNVLFQFRYFCHSRDYHSNSLVRTDITKCKTAILNCTTSNGFMAIKPTFFS